MPMRRLCLILLCGLVAVPAALAAARAPGDGVLELSKVNGTVVVAGTRGRCGARSTRASSSSPTRSPATAKCSSAARSPRRPGVLDGTTIYGGTDIRFRVTGGKYRLSLKGTGIDLTAVGVGTAQLSGDLLAETPGNYALDSGKWIPVPYFPASRLVLFGVQPTAAGSPSSTP